MPDATPSYQRLPGRGTRSQSVISVTRTYCRLWLGPDHLLCVDSEGYTEDYKRFYYRDIQALILRKSKRGQYWNLGLGAPILPLALIALGIQDPVGAGLLWGFAGVFLLCLAGNWLCGPTCVCHVRTAVHVEELPSLNRLRLARRVFARLRPLIEQAQGALPAFEPGQGAERLTGRTLPGPEAVSAAPVPGKPMARHEHGTAHEVLFFLLLTLALSTGVTLFYHTVPLLLANTVLSVAGMGCTVIALIKQYESDLTPGVRRVVWVTAGVYGVLLIVDYVQTVMLSMEHPDTAGNQWEMVKLIAARSPFESPFALAIDLVSIGTHTLLGILGLAWLNQFRRQSEVPPPLVLAPAAGGTPGTAGPASSPTDVQAQRGSPPV